MLSFMSVLSFAYPVYLHGMCHVATHSPTVKMSKTGHVIMGSCLLVTG